ncbi:MAG: MBL fold metallo-hydrolase [Candidatus Dormibacteria bacterium]
MARSWHVSVHVHPRGMPLPTGKLAYTDPIDRVMGSFVRLLPSGEFDECLRIATAFDPALGVPGLPGWTCIPTPGHTPGHVSYFRAGDRVLITGDALLTASAKSLWGLIPSPQVISPPPRISTWDWAEAMESIRTLAGLEPLVLAPGHGLPITTPAAQLHAFADTAFR